MRLEILGMQGKSVRVRRNGRSVMIVQEGGFLSAERILELPLRAISSIEVKKPGLLCGFIHFNTLHNDDINLAGSLLEGVRIASRSENAVLFRGEENYAIALRIRAYISEQSIPGTAGSGTGTPNPATRAHSPADELRKYRRLRDEGTISQEEFDELRRRLLEASF